MEVTISKFRRDLFRLVEASLKGEEVTFIHKGIHFKLAPQIETNRFSRLTPMQVVNPKAPDVNGKHLMAEMKRSWEKDWADL